MILPHDYREARQNGVTLVAHASLLDALLAAGALRGLPPQAWGEHLFDVGGGRLPLSGIRVPGHAQVLLVKSIRRGGVLGPLLGGRLPLARIAREIALSREFAGLGIPTPRVLAARIEASHLPGVARRVDSVMEWVDGVDLATWLIRRPPRAVQRQVLARAGVVVARMHAAGIDHQDLNLRNLLVDRGGQVHLLDLGDSRRTARDRRAANLARLYRSVVKAGCAVLGVNRGDIACFLRGYADGEWPAVFRAAARCHRRTAALHRLGWTLRAGRRG